MVHYGRESFRTHQVSQATFEEALAQFGVQGLTELTNLMGCYALLAFNVNAFGAELPAETTEKPLAIWVAGPPLSRRYDMATQTGGVPR